MSTDSPIRLAIVNDYELVVKGLAGALAPFADRVEVVELAVNVPVESDVDVVLFDSFAQTQGACTELRDLVHEVGSAGARLAVYSWNVDEALVQDSLKAGASGYLAKSMSSADLVESIERVHAGARVVPPMGSGGDDEGTEDDATGDAVSWPGRDLGLSGRESEMLALIVQGLTNQEIAERTYLSINSVKTYIRTAYRKLEVTSRSQAVAYGMSHGFEPDRSRMLQRD
ncbi:MULTISPECIES: response regulator transcription factor [Nocardioides]|uniref:response regulator transcription factor n=1 Tax=Nocardioides TaxID=1839 RepID=UPI00203AFB47|nr:response regulator transcription factor [Nocardioides sp. P86]MCM3513883.1 response regulator transcription factor [Nocardioides sp. P86]